ncbi:MAG: ATP-grasp domain-containing protein [Rubritepida sp.]|nr:ATP-grasp domain-containing protein [Rubritepida sp.]
MKTVLLTLGRLPKGLDVARSFAANGWRVVVAEPFGWTLVGASRSVAASHRVSAPAAGHAAYLADLARVVIAEDVSLVVPISEETMHVAHLPGVPVFTGPAAAVLRAHHKLGFVEWAGELGLDVPETHALGTPEAAALAARADFITKPVHACSGRGVRFFTAGDAPPDETVATVLQARLRGDIISSCAIARQGRVVGNALYRGTQFSGSVAIAFERIAHPAAEEWIARFVAGTGWTGFVSFDFIVDGAGRPWAIECNPRTTSGLHFFATADIAPAVLEGRPPQFRPERELQQFYSCLTELRPGRRGYFARLRRLAGLRDACWEWRDPWPFVSMIGTSWPIIREAGRRGATFGEVATLDVGWKEGKIRSPSSNSY